MCKVDYMCWCVVLAREQVERKPMCYFCGSLRSTGVGEFEETTKVVGGRGGRRWTTRGVKSFWLLWDKLWRGNNKLPFGTNKLPVEQTSFENSSNKQNLLLVLPSSSK